MSLFANLFHKCVKLRENECIIFYGINVVSILPWKFPYFGDPLVDVSLTGGDHLVGDFHKE